MIVGCAEAQAIGTLLRNVNDLGTNLAGELGSAMRPEHMRVVRSVTFNDYCIWWEKSWGRKLTVSELLMLKKASKYWYEVTLE